MGDLKTEHVVLLLIVVVLVWYNWDWIQKKWKGTENFDIPGVGVPSDVPGPVAGNIKNWVSQDNALIENAVGSKFAAETNLLAQAPGDSLFSYQLNN